MRGVPRRSLRLPTRGPSPVRDHARSSDKESTSSVPATLLAIPAVPFQSRQAVASSIAPLASPAVGKKIPAPSRIAKATQTVLHGGMHVVVVGCGRVGSGLAVRLSDEGHSVAIIDRMARSFRRLPDDWSGIRVVGSGFDRDDLDRAGARGAGALAAVTSGDNSNILTARIARETYQIPNVVARIYDPRRAQIYQRLGIPTVATVTWTIDQVASRLIPASLAGEWTDPTGTLLLASRPLPEQWAGRRLKALGIPGKISLIAVARADQVRLDVSDLVGQEGDLLHLAVSKDALDKLEGLLGPDAAGDAGAAPAGAAPAGDSEAGGGETGTTL